MSVNLECPLIRGSTVLSRIVLVSQGRKHSGSCDGHETRMESQQLFQQVAATGERFRASHEQHRAFDEPVPREGIIRPWDSS